MSKASLSGNEAVARGIWEHGVHFAVGYPGTPSTEILETVAARHPEVDCQWSINEKVALEVGGGASMAGARTVVTMKHVGLNVAADPFFSFSYAGAPAGLVVVSADDPGMHSSQNEQDNRYYSRFARVMTLEPSSSQECVDFIGESMRISEEFDTPILFRMTTRICHSKSVVELGERKEVERKGFKSNPGARVLMPSNARGRHVFVLERTERLREFCETSPLNRVEKGDPKLGVITNGVSYNYVKEVMPEASVLKLGITWPLPEKLLHQFADSVDELIVVEEGDPILENDLKVMGIQCRGKKNVTGELSPERVRADFLPETVAKNRPTPNPAPKRPPVLCPGCMHRSVFFNLKKLGLSTSGDIGCYTLGAVPPLACMETCICMGDAISGMEGFEKGAGKGITKELFALIGDSTFMHSGITGLADMVYNRSTATVIIVDNGITAMTGRQDHPATGRDIRGREAPRIDLASLCRGVGVEHVLEVDPFDLAATKAVLKQERERDTLSVIIFRRPCVLLERSRKKAFALVDEDKCVECGICFQLGCPAIEKRGEKAYVNPQFCYPECTMCIQACPKDAISQEVK